MDNEGDNIIPIRLDVEIQQPAENKEAKKVADTIENGRNIIEQWPDYQKRVAAIGAGKVTEAARLQLAQGIVELTTEEPTPGEYMIQLSTEENPTQVLKFSHTRWDPFEDPSLPAYERHTDYMLEVTQSSGEVRAILHVVRTLKDESDTGQVLEHIIDPQVAAERLDQEFEQLQQHSQTTSQPES